MINQILFLVPPFLVGILSLTATPVNLEIKTLESREQHMIACDKLPD